MKTYDVIVIGGGPAGLAAAVSACDAGASVCLIEREARLGGILKQCVHDGFGLLRYGERLTGPEYAQRDIDAFRSRKIDSETLTFVTKIEKTDNGFTVHAVNRAGVTAFACRALVLATGCRERTAKQVFIHGTRPAGVFTAGTAQHFTNLLGLQPAKKCVILGSGDIGLIMARRLTLEGAEVLGVYEAKPTPSGLTRNIHQCLHDFNIPLYLSHTVTRVFGADRVTAVEVSRVDENMVPVPGTQQTVECDTLILSVGLIPENEIAVSLGVPLDPRTKGPVVDGQYMTGVPGVFCCGNALHVNDLVDCVSQNAAAAGRNAALYKKMPAAYQPPGPQSWGRKGVSCCMQTAHDASSFLYNKKADRRTVQISADRSLLYFVPQTLDLNRDNAQVTVYFRSREPLDGAAMVIRKDGEEVFRKKYAFLRPPEMETLDFDFSALGLTPETKLEVEICKC